MLQKAKLFGQEHTKILRSNILVGDPSGVWFS
jgi:hypothetical protein